MDHGLLNIPLAKRGDIDKQIDAYKAKIAKTETIEQRGACKVLCKGGFMRVFANMTQAKKAAERTGGEAAQSKLSKRFYVMFE